MGQLEAFVGDVSLLIVIIRKIKVDCSTRNIIGMHVSGNGQVPVTARARRLMPKILGGQSQKWGDTRGGTAYWKK